MTLRADQGLHFGIQGRWEASGTEWRRFAQAAEDHGYSILLVSHHLHEQFAMWSSLAAAAAVTSHMHVGTYVAAAPLHTPEELLLETATLQTLSDGRFELGLGCGWSAEDFEAAQVPFATFRARLRRLTETVQLLKAIRSGTQPTAAAISTEYGKVSGVAPEWEPTAIARTPLLIGGGTPDVLRLATAEADVVSICVRLPPEGLSRSTAAEVLRETVEHKSRLVDEACASRGTGRPVKDMMVLDGAIGPDWRETAERLASWLGIPSADLLASPHFVFGDVPRVVDHLVAIAEAMDIRRFSIPDRLANSFAPVISRLA